MQARRRRRLGAPLLVLGESQRAVGSDDRLSAKAEPVSRYGMGDRDGMKGSGTRRTLRSTQGVLGLLVGQHADHDTVRIANEEATDAPRLVNRTVDDLVPGLDCFSVRRIDGSP